MVLVSGIVNKLVYFKQNVLFVTIIMKEKHNDDENDDHNNNTTTTDFQASYKHTQFINIKPTHTHLLEQLAEPPYT